MRKGHLCVYYEVLFILKVFLLFLGLINTLLAQQIAPPFSSLELDWKRLIQRADSLKLSQQPYWLLLLHYRNGKSEITGGQFFFSETGHIDPRSELHATIKALFISSQETNDQKIISRNQPPRCHFPARYAWLKKKLGIRKKTQKKQCPDLDFWLRILDYESISLVFASYYLNAPASLFGHTLLKINTHKYAKATLLDYATNFAAYPGDIDFLRYALYGLFGGFPGRFSFLPYHLKVREYNDFENRDLWEYKLNLDTMEIKKMVLHLWELNKATFDYYYMNGNCSYQLLSLLEIARPSLRLRKEFNFIVIPAETLKLLKKEKLIKDITFRPSTSRILGQKIDSLNEAEKKAFFLVADQKVSFQQAIRNIPNLGKERELFILDTLLSFLRYQISQIKSKKSSREKKNKESLYESLIKKRLKSPPASKEHKFIIKSEDMPPHLNHALRLISFSIGYSNYGYFNNVRSYMLYHDLLAQEDALPKSTELLFLNFDIRYYEKFNRIVLHQLDLISLFSLTPYKQYRKDISYVITIGNNVEYAKTKADSNTRFSEKGPSQNTYTRALGGATWGIFENLPVNISALFGARYRYAKHYPQEHQIGPEGMLILLGGEKSWKYKLSVEFIYYNWHRVPNIFQIDFHYRKSLQKNLEWRAIFSFQNNYHDILFGLYYFF